MDYVKVKQKGQVTIPAAVRRQLNVLEGDVLELKVSKGTIVLVARELTPPKRGKRKKAKGLMSYFGSGKGLFSSPEEVDRHIRKERASWFKDL